jgi:hypothetical protein
MVPAIGLGGDRTEQQSQRGGCETQCSVHGFAPFPGYGVSLPGLV